MAVDRYVMDLGYQNIDEISNTIQKGFCINTLQSKLTRFRLGRIVQMRNIITHNRGIVNSIYLYKSRSKCDKLGLSVKRVAPLLVLKYLNGLVEKIDAEAVDKFDLHSIV